MHLEDIDKAVDMSSAVLSQKKMSFGDSKAVFEQRARNIGLTDAVIKLFTDASLDTFFFVLHALYGI